MKIFNTLLLSMFFTSLFATGVSADSVSGTITFDKRPPLGAIIYIASEQAATRDASIDQRDKAFTAKIIAGTPGAKAIFNNSDGDDHNIFVNDIEHGVNFDIGLIPSGEKSEVVIDWQPNSLVRIGCKIHPKMKAYLANVNSNHYKILEFDNSVLQYSFELADVPSDGKIIVMLPKYDTLEIPLQRGAAKTVTLTRKGKTRGSITLERS